MTQPPAHLTPRRPRRRRVTLRTRVTVVASLGITAAVVLGLLIMYLLQVNSIRRTIDNELHTYAAQIAQSAPAGTWPQPLPASSLDSNAQAQVLTSDNKVLAATRGLAGQPALYALHAGSDTPVRQRAADGVIPTEIRLVTLRTTFEGRHVTVVTGTSTDLLEQLNTEFLRQLFVGFPIILLLAAGAVWLVVGRALRPVTRIRHAVTEITSADLSRRIPEPGTADEIGHLAQTMNAMLSRLESSALEQRRFVADASHELRSPLAAIRTTLEVGLAHPDRAPWPVIAGRAAEQSIRLESLIQQLLTLAKADEESRVAGEEHVDIADLLRRVTVPAPNDPITIRLTATGTPVIRGDTDHLERLFGNVIDNAVRYARTTVHVTAATTGGDTVVEIADDGPGIPAADRDRVFDRFVRLDTSRERRTGNAGLGLAIAREIAKAHHGSIHAAESPDGGARFVITLPTAPPP
ncbi:sensor histidine kinase [Streptomyces adustus]|uniref:sensor histidine kinase n=1 Tax=Streptomyces adustus TaxID=1609272 RepID=UPI003719DD91